jgi:ankyrin repeat protein
VDTAHINQSTPGAGLCALIDAAMRGHADVIEVLLRHNADINIRRKNGKTALHVAVEEAHIECVLLLCASGSDLTATDSAGRTPAMLSSVSEISEFLNAKGANDRELVDAYRNRYRRATNEALGSPAFIGHQADAPDWRNEP